jgi:hypothetical protein
VVPVRSCQSLPLQVLVVSDSPLFSRFYFPKEPSFSVTKFEAAKVTFLEY